MSGGSYDYFFARLEEFARDVARNTDVLDGTLNSRLRAAFVKTMEHAAVAAKAIEWEDSSDTGPADTVKALEEFYSSLGIDPKMVADATAWRTLARLMPVRMENND